MTVKDIWEYLFGKSDLSDPSLYSLDMSAYSGTKSDLYDGKGNVLSSSDTRDIQYERVKKILEINSDTEEFILNEAPIYKQMNAAMGLLNPNDRDILQTRLQARRNKAKALKQRVLAAQTIEDIEQIKMTDIE